MNESQDGPGGEADPCIEAMGDLAPRLLRVLAMLELAQRHLHPPALPTIAAELRPLAEELGAATTRFAAVAWPEPLYPVRDRMTEASALAAGACAGIDAQSPEDVLSAYRALRKATRAQETLWPLAAVLPPFSRFFLERALPDDVALALLERLSAATTESRPGRGLFHEGNEALERGGFSVYVPEWVPDDVPMPLVMALHGGSGHGRDFLQAWIREARTRGCVLVAPTSPDRTWSFTGGSDTDAERLFELVRTIQGLVPVDPERMLLTGMSDGGTYALLTGLREDSPFTALAPFSCVLSPEVFADGRIARARDLPIRYVHGALDWMFPLQLAQEAAVALEGAGAKLEFLEIADLSHTYARDENGRVLDWFGVPQPTLAQASGAAPV
jgi:phospholipase/carboxylesterase